jgi:predicted transposase/invertase (TIGR01784 family)
MLLTIAHMLAPFFTMPYYLEDKYVNLLTDFGFKRVFGTEPNKQILVDFLNTLLPSHHHIQNLTFRSTENLGNTPIDRKAIFDIYCQSVTGDRFIVEIQKAKQNFFKDRSVYYSTFPIQEQALQGIWNYELSPVYTIGILDFVFDDHKDDPTIIHTVQLKNQDCQVFYDKLKFIYIELPKFTKTIDQLESHLDKWLFILRHLPELTDRPESLQDSAFNQLFEIAELANFSRLEQDSYQNSLKYYRDMNNVVDTSRQEGFQEGFQEGRDEGLEAGLKQGREAERTLGRQKQRSLLLKLLSRQLGNITPQLQAQVNELSDETFESLSDEILDFSTLEDLAQWLRSL